MSVVLAMGAGLLAAPEWRHPPALSPSDYPQTALRDGKSAAAVVVVLVSPKGKVVWCRATEGYGDEQLVGSLCSLIKSKRITPAVDADGTPAYGLRREMVRLWLPGNSQSDAIGALQPQPDVELQVAALPGVAGNSADLRVTVAIDEEGKVAHCEFDAAGGLENLKTVACEQLRQTSLDAVADDDEAPVRYVRKVWVRFVVKP